MVDPAKQIGRRAVLRGALASLAVGASASVVAAASDAPRLAATDWAMLETALALGLTPVSACELIRFRADAMTPTVPAPVVDLGLRGAPNFELLQLTRPSLVLSSPWYSQIRGRLSAIAPVLDHAVYIPGNPPWPAALSALHVLAEQVGRPDVAHAVQAQALDEIAALRSRLVPFRDRPVYVIEIGDARHFRAFGDDSMFGNVLTLLGLENAWTDRTAFSFAAPLPLERLARRPEARILAVSGIPPEAAPGLRRSVLWTHLPAVAMGRFATLESVNAFGGVPAGLRFARLLTAALSEGRAG